MHSDLVLLASSAAMTKYSIYVSSRVSIAPIIALGADAHAVKQSSTLATQRSDGEDDCRVIYQGRSRRPREGQGTRVGEGVVSPLRMRSIKTKSQLTYNGLTNDKVHHIC